MGARRIMVYVQHLLGIGHQMRAAAIIRAMRAGGLNVTCVSGGEAGAMPDLGGARLVQLPSVRATDASFRSLVDENGDEIDGPWRDRRRQALLRAYTEYEPDVLLVETFPFGRWQFRFELIPLLQAASDNGVPAAVSVRDILVGKNDPKRLAAVVGILRDYFSAVLVHGDESLVTFGETFAAAGEIADLIEYTGYVAPEPPPPNPRGRGAGEVVVAAGGGAVGGVLLRAAIEARPLTPLADAPWRLITGPNLPAAERARLNPPPGVEIETLCDDYRELLARAAVSVSQAGYNTVMDILVSGARAVLAPFSAGNETEQGLRARLLAERGRVQVVSEPDLTPQNLAAAIGRALAGDAPARLNLALDGAARTARIVAALARPK